MAAQALKLCREGGAFREGGDFAAGHLHRGRALLGLGRMVEAKLAYSAAQTLQPGSVTPPTHNKPLWRAPPALQASVVRPARSTSLCGAPRPLSHPCRPSPSPALNAPNRSAGCLRWDMPASARAHN